VEGSGRDFILRYYPGICQAVQRKTTKNLSQTSVRAAEPRAEISIRNLSNTKQDDRCSCRFVRNVTHLLMKGFKTNQVSEIITPSFFLNMSMVVFWVMTPCGRVCWYRRFGSENGGVMFLRNCGVHLDVNTTSQPRKRRHVPEDHRKHLHSDCLQSSLINSFLFT
jgi:hypothetical protein